MFFFFIKLCYIVFQQPASFSDTILFACMGMTTIPAKKDYLSRFYLLYSGFTD